MSWIAPDGRQSLGSILDFAKITMADVGDVYHARLQAHEAVADFEYSKEATGQTTYIRTPSLRKRVCLNLGASLLVRKNLAIDV